MMNIQELQVAIDHCCGVAVDKGGLPCPKCRKRKRRIKNIKKEIDRMWKMHDEGLLDRPYRKKKDRPVEKKE